MRTCPKRFRVIAAGIVLSVISVGAVPGLSFATSDEVDNFDLSEIVDLDTSQSESLQSDESGDSPQSEDTSNMSRSLQTDSLSDSGVSTFGTISNQPLRTTAINGGYFDFDNDRVYLATRSASPSKLFIRTTGGSAIGEKRFAASNDGKGSWAVAKSGKYTAVVSEPKESKYTVNVQVYETGSTSSTPNKIIPLPGATSSQSIVEDTYTVQAGSGIFWVGSSNSNGSSLFRVDVNANNGAGKAILYKSWSGSRFSNVRALTCDETGVTIGLGNPGALWKLTTDGQTAKSKVFELTAGTSQVASTAMVYSLASYTPTQVDSAESAEESSESGQEVEVLSMDADLPMSGSEDLEIESETDATEDSSVEDLGTSASKEETAVEVSATSNNKAYAIAGTEDTAKIVILDENGEYMGGADMSDYGRTIDRIAVDDQVEGKVWFTLRSSGGLYSFSLDGYTGGEVSVIAENVPTLVNNLSGRAYGSETRELAVNEGVVFGLDNTGGMWTFDPATGNSQTKQLVNEQMADPTVNSVIRLGNQTFVGGHWRYQAHPGNVNSFINIPGEAKTAVAVGNSVYAAIYPSAVVYKVNANKTAELVSDIGEGQVRPSKIVYNESLKTLAVATGPKYGSYGGGLSLIDPTAKTSELYANPVGDQKISALTSYKDNFIFGTNTSGEAAPFVSGKYSQIVRWAPQSGSDEGKKIWQISGNDPQLKWSASGASGSTKDASISGVTVVESPAGDFVLVSNTFGDIAAIDVEPDANGKAKVLWTSKTGVIVNDMQQKNGRIYALIGRSLYDVEATRTGIKIKKNDTLTNYTSMMDITASGDYSTELTFVVSGGISVKSESLNGTRPVYRTSGDSRYTTAVAVSNETFNKADTVVLATGTDYADALVAGPLAREKNAPILLTRPDILGQETINEISRLNAKNIVIIGGENAVSTPVVNQLVTAGINRNKITRIKGNTRYETALSVAEEVEKTSDTTATIAVVGTNFADAVTAVPAAATINASVVLVRPDSNSSEIKSFLDARETRAIGGGAVTGLQNMGISSKKDTAGADRYETAQKVTQDYSFSNSKRALVASGMLFPDALTGGVLATKIDAPMLLTRQDVVPDVTINTLKKNLGRNGIWLIGGDSVIGSANYERFHKVG